MGEHFLNPVPDALSQAHVPLTSGILIGMYITNIFVWQIQNVSFQ